MRLITPFRFYEGRSRTRKHSELSLVARLDVGLVKSIQSNDRKSALRSLANQTRRIFVGLAFSSRKTHPISATPMLGD
jgi:hypothetical protein